MQNHSVEIPESYLLIIAVRGNLGEGELPKLMQFWAMRECERLSLFEQLAEMQARHISDLHQRIRNTLGRESVELLDSAISKFMDNIAHTETRMGQEDSSPSFKEITERMLNR